MKLRRRRGRPGGSGADAGAIDRTVAALARFLRGPEGRWVRTALVVLLCFTVGYAAAARFLFRAADAAPDVRRAEVPDLRGGTAGEARDRLREEGMEARVEAWIHHPRAERGTVVAQSPLGGQVAADGDTVSLTLSRGPDVRAVPDLSGLSARQANLVLERMGFTVRTEVVSSGSGHAGVQGTRPAAGERVPVPFTVELLVGEGPQIALVPSLRGLHIDDVEARLEEAGLQLGTVRFDPDARAAPGRVIAQSPPSGYSLRGGGAVSVEVAGRAGEVDAPEGGEGVPEPDTPDGAEPGVGGTGRTG